MRAQQAVARRVQLMLPCMYKYTPGEEMAVRSCTKKKKAQWTSSSQTGKGTQGSQETLCIFHFVQYK